MPLPIIRNIDSRQALLELLPKNPGLIFIKFGAEWCAPCKKIEKDLEEHFNNMPDNVQCVILDIDECFDVYAYMKSKKMVKVFLALFVIKKAARHTYQMTYIVDQKKMNWMLFLRDAKKNYCK